MNYYRYKMIATTGEVSSGVIKLHYQDEMSVISHLERDGSVAILVRRLGPVLSFFFHLMTFRLRRKLPRDTLAELLSNLALMLRSGMTLISALEEAAGSAEVPEIENDMQDLVESIQGGMSFSDAADNYQHIFPKSVVHLLRMGEETGQLDRMLQDAADHLKRLQAIVTDTRNALLYPGFVVVTMTGGIFFWFYYVVPQIVGLFRDMDVTLPWITRLLITMSHYFQKYGAACLVGVILLVLLTYSGRRGNKQLRYIIDRLLLKLPVLSTIINASALAFITEYFSLLLNAGIDILQTMRILSDSVGNSVYSRKMVEIQERLATGEGISESFQNAKLFPRFVVRMLTVGEMSGNLTGQLDYIAGEYRRRLGNLVTLIGKMIEPAVLLFAGTIFAIILGALLLPIYDLLSRITS
ncbi:MAG: type II secretion system F family protein [Desulfosarcinaceae bacterium]|jgi:general secretion pathway protein F/type IV pilus assembly protein PilC